MADGDEREAAPQAGADDDGSAVAPDDREQLLATLAHDLKNPLSAVLVGAQNIMRLAVPDDVAPRLRRYADAIQRAGRRMNDLLHDVLDLTRLEQRTLPLDRTRRPMEDLVALAMAPLEEGAAARRVALRREIAPGLAALCDERYAVRAIANVVGNAVKHSREGGAVDVVVVARHAGELLVTVRDTGAGIPASDLAKVFGPYWRDADSPRSGMGVGLPLAKAIVEAHGGRIWLESVEGQGTTVSLTLPAAATAPE